MQWLWSGVTHFRQVSHDPEKIMNSVFLTGPPALTGNISVFPRAQKDSIHRGTLGSQNLGLFHDDVDPGRAAAVMLSPTDQTSSSKGLKSTWVDTLTTHTAVDSVPMQIFETWTQHDTDKLRVVTDLPHTVENILDDLNSQFYPIA
jgi:hypothetical protein